MALSPKWFLSIWKTQVMHYSFRTNYLQPWDKKQNQNYSVCFNHKFCLFFPPISMVWHYCSFSIAFCFSLFSSFLCLSPLLFQISGVSWGNFKVCLSYIWETLEKLSLKFYFFLPVRTTKTTKNERLRVVLMQSNNPLNE